MGSLTDWPFRVRLRAWALGWLRRVGTTSWGFVRRYPGASLIVTALLILLAPLLVDLLYALPWPWHKALGWSVFGVLEIRPRGLLLGYGLHGVGAALLIVGWLLVRQSPITRPDSLPDYCCAILEDPEGQLLLQCRGPDAKHAPGQLTCLGGARKRGEAPEACLRRELWEEIGWTPEHLERRVVLVVEGRLVAWFYRGTLDVDPVRLRYEPGLNVILKTRKELPGLPLSPWHRAAIEAEARGEARVTLSE